MIRTLGICLLVIFASGCSTTLQVTYRSEPPGAALYEGDKHMGTTPVTLNYQVTDEDKKQGHKYLRGTTVRWVSGANAGIPILTADFRNGFNQVFNFRRPDSMPGYDIDANYALQLQRNAIMMMQAAAQYQQAEAQRQQARQLELMRYQQQFQTPASRNVHCQSRVSGNTIYTDCN
jgi:hypothetical protein